MVYIIICIYSRISVIRTLKGPLKLFELWRFRIMEVQIRGSLLYGANEIVRNKEISNYGGSNYRDSTVYIVFVYTSFYVVCWILLVYLGLFCNLPTLNKLKNKKIKNILKFYS